MNRLPQISILGCGWLGLELAKHLMKSGYKVNGSTTSQHKIMLLKNEGINPFLISLSEQGVSGDLGAFVEKSELLIINIPPGLKRNPHKNHFKEIQGLVQRLQEWDLQYLIYVSSTTVFKDEIDFPEINNGSNPNGQSNSARQLIAIENLLMEHTKWRTAIIRPGGLFGAERHPGNQLSGRSDLKNPKAPLNLVHRNDVISVISALIQLSPKAGCFNVVYPYHPPKKDYYTNYCLTHNLTLPSYNDQLPSKGKIIDSSKTEQLLNLKLQHKP